MHSRQIRILFVEDVEVDMELAIRELLKERLKFTAIRVDTRAEFIKQLADFNPDLIISDYAIPGFDGMEALKIALEKAPGIPVILFTGSINEETAVECMKAGATDYILKNKIMRLPYAVREAMSQKESRMAKEKAIQALKDSEAMYRTFMDSAEDIAFFKDSELRYTMINKAGLSFFKRNELDILGKTDFDLMAEEYAKNCQSSDIKAISGKNLVITIERIGDQVFESRKFPIHLQNGKTGVGGFIRDITAAEKAESLLKLQGTALRSAANAILITDTEGKILYINPAFIALTGYSSEEALGKNPRELVKSGIHDSRFYQSLWNTISNGNVWQGEIINKRKDGSFYNEDNTITPVYNQDGQITQYVAIKQDITARKIAELAIEASERKYRMLVDNAILGIYTASLDGKFLMVNEPLCRILEASSDTELLDTPIFSIYRYPEQRKFLVDTLLKQGKILNYEVELISLKSTIKNVLINAILEGNNILGMVMDMTERKRSEQELLKAKERAEESDKLKSSFLANMSHEVRTPMNAILGYADLLKSPDYNNEEKQEYINVIRRSSQQLLHIMNDIVDMSKIATGQITSNPVTFELNAFLKEVYAEFLPLATQKKLNFTFSVGLTDKASWINFDDQKLKQILHNLIDNAIKFCDKGSVQCGYALKESVIEFYVKDTGIGIKPEFQNIIFERFRQLEDSYTRKYGGSGLGLSIAKSFTEFLGGKIWLESVPGSGSTFYFCIPFIPVESTAKNTQEAILDHQSFKGTSILVAEDDDINYIYLERLLSKTNSLVMRAANGQEAVDLVNSGVRIDMILMDINMPFMNGLEATRIIRNSHPELPIIAVTAYTLSGDRETCIAAGCNDYIPKPIRKDELISKMNDYLT